MSSANLVSIREGPLGRVGDGAARRPTDRKDGGAIDRLSTLDQLISKVSPSLQVGPSLVVLIDGLALGLSDTTHKSRLSARPSAGQFCPSATIPRAVPLAPLLAHSGGPVRRQAPPAQKVSVVTLSTSFMHCSSTPNPTTFNWLNWPQAASSRLLAFGVLHYFPTCRLLRWRCQKLSSFFRCAYFCP